MPGQIDVIISFNLDEITVSIALRRPWGIFLCGEPYLTIRGRPEVIQSHSKRQIPKVPMGPRIQRRPAPLRIPNRVGKHPEPLPVPGKPNPASQKIIQIRMNGIRPNGTGELQRLPLVPTRRHQHADMPMGVDGPAALQQPPVEGRKQHRIPQPEPTDQRDRFTLDRILPALPPPGTLDVPH